MRFEMTKHICTTRFAADPASFRSACQSLLTRMLDTVPKTVQLTEVIEPLPVKPQDISLTYMGDGTFHLTGQVRVRASNCISVAAVAHCSCTS